jgi:poly-gamma-glutamate capsule biosynthesis protein CapA/YwtB (metallophosphatase superfamily)
METGLGMAEREPVTGTRKQDKAAGRARRGKSAAPDAALGSRERPQGAAPEPPACTIALMGDAMLGRLVDGCLADRGFAYPWGNLLPLLRGADLRMVNLECALTQATDRWHDGAYRAFYFRARPGAVETLKLAGIDCVSLANNHTCDYGFEGMAETLAVLGEAGIAHAGAGRNLAAARAPAQLTAGGLTVAVVALADSPPGCAATAESPGIHYVPVPPKPTALAEVAAAVTEAKRSADFCIVSVHGGPNMRDRPPREFRELARRLIEAGADAFWGHGAHVVQAVEWHRGRPILYDAGDIVDDYAADETLRNDLSGLFLLRVGPTGVEGLRFVPVALADMRARLARGRDRAWLVQKLAELCREMGTGVEDDGRAVRVVPGEAPAAEPPARG